MATSYEAGVSPWRLSSGAITLKRYDSEVSVSVVGADSDYWCFDAWSSDQSIVRVSSMSETSDGVPYFTVEKEGVGVATVTVEDDGGNRQTITVTCKPTDFKVYQGSYTFSKKTKYSSFFHISAKYEGNHAPDSRVKAAKSSKPSVASVKVEKGSNYAYAKVTPKKAGSAKVTVTDQYNRTNTVIVKVKKGYFKSNLKAVTNGYSYYGSKQVNVYSRAGAKVTVRIGGEKHTKRANKFGSATIHLKKAYKIGTKFSVTSKTARAKVTKTNKVASNSYCRFNGCIRSCQTRVPVRVSNVHKGDVLTIAAGREKHTIKFYGDYSSFSTSFYMNKTMGNYYYLKLTLKNKYKQKLDSTDWQIRW